MGNKGIRLRWPAASKSAASRISVKNMPMLDELMRDEWGEDHRLLKDLLRMMLTIDPRQRPSASQCLSHSFFHTTSDDRQLNSKSTEKTQISSSGGD